MAQVTLEEVNLNLEQLHSDFNEIKKMYQGIQGTLNLIYNDRDLLTEIQESLLKERQLIMKTDRRNEDFTTDIKETVETTGQEVKNETNKIKQSLPGKVVTNIQDTFNKEKTTLKKKGFFTRLTSKFKH